MPRNLVDLYKSLKNDLPALSPDCTRRPEPEDVLPALRRAASLAA